MKCRPAARFCLTISLLISFAAIVSLAPLSAHAKESGWQTVSSSKGRFSVEMPGAPTTYSKAKHTKIGNIGEEFYSFKDKEKTFTVEYSDLPEIAVIFGGRHDIYKRTKNGFLGSTHGEQISFNDITIGGKKGKLLVYATPTRTGKVLMVLIKKRLYIVQGSIVKEAKDKAAVDKFINSFRPI